VTIRSGADRYLETITSVIESLASTAEDPETSERLVRALVQHFDGTLAEIWLREGDNGGQHGGQHVGQHFGQHGDKHGGLHRMAAYAVAGEPPAADAALGTRLAGMSEPSTEAHGSGYLLVYPIQARVHDDRSWGVLTVYSDNPFPDAAVHWARIYAGIAAATLDNSRVLQDSRKAITQLQFLVEASQVLNSTLDLGELLDLILKLALREIGADRGSVYLVDHEHRQIWTILAQGLEQQEIRLSFGQGVAGTVAETGETIMVEDAYTFPLFDRSFDEKFGYRTRSILCIPIRNRSKETAGILQLVNKFSGPFTREDEEFLNAMSLHMALALENARLHREVVEKKRLERELQLARGIQRNLLPEAPPVLPGFDIAVLNEPCFEVGGDYYDFLTMGPNTLLVVVADVEGKGVSSAMVMSNLQATLHALVMHLHSLEVLTLSLNEQILADTHSGKFLSCFLGLIDTNRGGLHYINAGHVPPLVMRRSGEVVSLEEGGMVIGLFSAVDYNRGAVKLLPGDVLAFCTDGIMEACDANQDEYGAERLAESINRYRDLPAADLVREVVREVAEYSKDGVHIDDKVLLVVKVLDLPEAGKSN